MKSPKTREFVVHFVLFLGRGFWWKVPQWNLKVAISELKQTRRGRLTRTPQNESYNLLNCNAVFKLQLVDGSNYREEASKIGMLFLTWRFLWILDVYFPIRLCLFTWFIILCFCFSLPVFSEGIYWMNIVSSKLIYCCSNRVIEVFSLNHLCDFWTLSRCSVTSLSLVSCRGKSTRVMAVGNDSRYIKSVLHCICGTLLLKWSFNW